jgi:hypothetical protein
MCSVAPDVTTDGVERALVEDEAAPSAAAPDRAGVDRPVVHGTRRGGLDPSDGVLDVQRGWGEQQVQMCGRDGWCVRRFD